MNDAQTYEYTRLLEKFKTVLSSWHSRHGWTMEQLAIVKEIQEFEASLECNQEPKQLQYRYEK